MEPLTITSTPANCHILNNSPALHSLKRQQLVQLCKRNGIKATGKNTEIIEKLKAHALKSPLNSDSNIYQYMASSDIDDEDGDKENRRMALPRPSEAWSVIEEDSREIERVQMGLKDIREEVEQEMQTVNSSLRSFGASVSNDFGNGTTSSKASTMKQSIKAFAISLKRGGSKMSTATTSGPASMPVLPGLTTPATPPPAESQQPWKPSPLPSPATGCGDTSISESIIEMGEHTIRLVKNDNSIPSPPALRPFIPTFEATYSPESVSRIKPYPSLAEFQQPQQPAQADPESDPPLPGGWGAPAAPKRSAVPSSPPPFVFGSPVARVSNTQFNSAAQSVLAEMNARLGIVGTEDEVGIDLLTNRGKVAPAVSIFGNLDTKPKTEIATKFDKLHEKEFQRMEGIGDWFARKNTASPERPQ
ncbi:hypothetical protein M422DRAFT_54808 [Sphaerobolus stellatus SS14]|uniref:SAP domain-containing protein n=1 Tax=Sphaerobolus stellatus (strain SS14) TaxID=990650 RepID=A0A0C9URK1_SPHS4|nr:hypothetical protein M422DRAFT_54808 [Sphaerobolus stellatus SS14]